VGRRAGHPRRGARGLRRAELRDYGYEEPYEPEPTYAPPPAIGGPSNDQLAEAILAIGGHLEETQRSQQADALVEQYPELGEPGPARQLIDDAIRTANALGAPELAGRPAFWAVLKEARDGRTAARQQRPSSQLTAESIVSGGNPGRRGSGALPFGGMQSGGRQQGRR